MSSRIYFSHDFSLVWKGSTGMLIEWAWFILNHNYERKVPVFYAALMAFAHYGSSVSFSWYYKYETEYLSIKDFYDSMKLYRELEIQRLSEGKTVRLGGDYSDYLDKALAMAEIRLEQLQKEKEEGTWTPTENAIDFKKSGHSRPMISSDSISLRGGLVWKVDTELANKAVGRILNKDLDALLPLVTTYELVTDRKEVRFNIHKDFAAELESVNYAHDALKEWCASESVELNTLTKKELPKIAELLTMFEQRLKELNEGDWKPFEGEHRLGHDLCGWKEDRYWEM